MQLLIFDSLDWVPADFITEHTGSVKLAADWRLDIHIREYAAECETGGRLGIGHWSLECQNNFLKNFSILKINYNKQQRQHSAKEHFYQLNNRGQHQYEFKDIIYTLKFFFWKEHFISKTIEGSSIWSWNVDKCAK